LRSAFNREEIAVRINTKQIRRLVTIVDMLRKDSCPTTEDITVKIMAVDPMQRVGMRTIQRDLAALREEFGAPIIFDQKRRGFLLSDRKWDFGKSKISASEKTVFDATPTGPRLKLVRIACEPSAAERIESNPLASDQTITRLPDGGALVELLFVSSDAVTDWVLRQRGLAVVIYPENLAESIGEIASQIAGMHVRDRHPSATGSGKVTGRQKVAKSRNVRNGRSAKAKDSRNVLRG
jgi:predicted DNA-binding transcriptional regulator YafY